MLKVFLGFMVSVVGLLSSAYVGPPAYAASAQVLITRIQAGAVGVATQEFVVIYNNSPEDVAISGWCLTNKNSVVITCFQAPTGQVVYLPAYKHATAVSTSLAITLPTGTVTSTYVPTSQSSGSITGSSDTISLIDHAGMVVDRQSWTMSLGAGMQFERLGTGIPTTYQDTDAAADWSVTLPGMLAVDETRQDTMIVDVCLNIDGIQPLLPIGKEIDTAGECIDRVIMRLAITEVLPNAAGSDEGREFIELYNPHDVAVELSKYKLFTGLANEGSYTFPAGSSIPPLSYITFSNSAIPFTLLNSSSRVLLALQDGTIVSEVPAYMNPKDDQSWAVINDVWQYVTQPTPGFANILPIDIVTAPPELIVVAQPCAANQYRSPETNHCRLISPSSTGAVTPCKDGQYRNEETNRCRTIASETKTITPCSADEERNPDTNRCRKIVTATAPTACKEGQERNPDTNRCRTITKMPTIGYGVLGAETKSSGNWYAVAAVVGVLGLAIGYAAWEWHDELGKFFRKLVYRVGRFARIRK